MPEEESQKNVSVVPSPNLKDPMNVADPTWTDAQPQDGLSRNASLETIPGHPPQPSPSPPPPPSQHVEVKATEEAPKASVVSREPASHAGGGTGDESDLDESASNVVGPGGRDPNYFKFLGSPLVFFSSWLV